jgi:hypothetical protein
MGKTLQRALDLIPNTEDKFFNGIGVREKLQNGENLSNDELHIVCDVFISSQKNCWSLKINKDIKYYALNKGRRLKIKK